MARSQQFVSFVGRAGRGKPNAIAFQTPFVRTPDDPTTGWFTIVWVYPDRFDWTLGSAKYPAVIVHRRTAAVNPTGKTINQKHKSAPTRIDTITLWKHDGRLEGLRDVYAVGPRFAHGRVSWAYSIYHKAKAPEWHEAEVGELRAKVEYCRNNGTVEALADWLAEVDNHPEVRRLLSGPGKLFRDPVEFNDLLTDWNAAKRDGLYDVEAASFDWDTCKTTLNKF